MDLGKKSMQLVFFRNIEQFSNDSTEIRMQKLQIQSTAYLFDNVTAYMITMHVNLEILYINMGRNNGHDPPWTKYSHKVSL